MRRSENGQSRNRAGRFVGKLALIAFMVLTAVPLASGASKNDKDQQETQVYQNTFDEVFQAAQDSIQRLGYFITDKNKDKGTISANGDHGKFTFNLHIESLNTKPETRVTINGKVTGAFMGAIGRIWNEQILTEMQKVLSTYR